MNSPLEAKSDRLCPECGYRLDGLPESGRCPECGFEYSPDQIVFYGWEAGDVTVVTARSNVLAVFLSFGIITSCFAIVLLYAGFWIGGSIALLGGIAVAAIEFTIRRRLRAATPAPMQLRLFPQGYGARTGLGPVRLEPWSEKIQARFVRNRHVWLVSIRKVSPFLELKYKPLPIFIEFEADGDVVENARVRIENWRIGKGIWRKDASK